MKGLFQDAQFRYPERVKNQHLVLFEFRRLFSLKHFAIPLCIQCWPTNLASILTSDTRYNIAWLRRFSHCLCHTLASCCLAFYSKATCMWTLFRPLLSIAHFLSICFLTSFLRINESWTSGLWMPYVFFPKVLMMLRPRSWSTQRAWTRG